MKKLLIPLILSCSLLLASESNAISPSFDCSNEAKLNRVEKLICSDEELSRLDREMNKAYKYMLSTLDEAEKQELVIEQGAWVKERDKIDSIGSLEVKYITRLFYLKPLKKFTLNYSTDNETCEYFTNILNTNIVKPSDKPLYIYKDTAYTMFEHSRKFGKSMGFNVLENKEFNQIKWKILKRPFNNQYEIDGDWLDISYFDINNDGVDEAVFLYNKYGENGNNLYYLSEKDGKMIEQNNISSIDQISNKALNGSDKNTIDGNIYINQKRYPYYIVAPEQYVVKYKNTYYLFLLGMGEGHELYRKEVGFGLMFKNGYKAVLIKYNPSNNIEVVCSLTRAIPETETILFYMQNIK